MLENILFTFTVALIFFYELHRIFSDEFMELRPLIETVLDGLERLEAAARGVL